MYVEKERVHIPEFIGGKWVNSEELSVRKFTGKVILADFWDYTCVNCIRTLPYVKEWHRRYSDKGLVIIGVHAPEFFFARTEENVKRAIGQFGIEYPVVMDNDYKIWHAFANHYWPAKYMADKKGYIRYTHFGEGNYIETEVAIQLLLREINQNIELPDLMKPVRDMDIPGISCYRVSPELYFGYRRENLGNREDNKRDGLGDYTLPEKIKDDTIYVEGKWFSAPEYMKPALDNGNGMANVILKYTSSEVNAVISPDGEKGFKIFVIQDGRYLNPEDAGHDIQVDTEGKSYIVVDEPRMYYLVKNREFGSRLLKLSSNSSAFAIYAFTFVGCTA
jgi:thiol-disulfide isomerase/thioredoxin